MSTVSSSADSAVQSAVVINTIIAVVGSLLFVCLRRKLPGIYAPRLTAIDTGFDHHSASVTSFSSIERIQRQLSIVGAETHIPCSSLERPKELPNSWFSWFVSLWRVDEEEFFRVAGMDAFMFVMGRLYKAVFIIVYNRLLSIFRFGVKMFTVCTVFGLVVLLSIDATDSNIPVCHLCSVHLRYLID
jgi:hypothetical protein